MKRFHYSKSLPKFKRGKNLARTDLARALWKSKPTRAQSLVSTVKGTTGSVTPFGKMNKTERHATAQKIKAARKAGVNTRAVVHKRFGSNHY